MQNKDELQRREYNFILFDKLYVFVVSLNTFKNYVRKNKAIKGCSLIKIKKTFL